MHVWIWSANGTNETAEGVNLVERAISWQQVVAMA